MKTKQKNTWMKLLLIGILSSLALLSCKKIDYANYDYYKYNNQSSNQIKVHVFTQEIKYEHIIQINETLTQIIDRSVPSDNIFYGDSIHVIFNDGKYIRYNNVLDSIAKQSLTVYKLDNYEINYKDRDADIIYDFTDEHYANALDAIN